MMNPDSTDVLRRSLLLAAGSACLSACAANQNLNLVSRTVFGKHQSAGRYPISDEQIRALPYATLGVRVGSGARAVMVLSRIESGEQYWVSADHVIFVIRNGRLIRTKGLRRDLAATRWVSADPLAMALPNIDDRQALRDIERVIDVTGGTGSEQVAVASSFDRERNAVLKTIDGAQDTRCVEEKVTVADWRWATRNTFWLDAGTGLPVKSRQQFCPEVPAIEMEVLKRPRNL